MNIKFNDLSSQWSKISDETLPKIINLMDKGNFILGEEVSIFEDNFKKWNGNNYAVGVSNGTDALIISVSSLPIEGSTMFYIPANTYIATLLGIVLSTNKNYKYELIDCDDFFQIDCNKLEKSIEDNINDFDNHVVIPVHLYGSCCDMNKIMQLKDKYNLIIIEDCSQSHGTVTSEGKKVGTYGDVAAFSLYPGKNLGAAGDAGIIVTNNEEIYKKCLMIRNLGSIEKYKHDIIGRNSRLDTIQSIILNEKLKYIDDWNLKRNYVSKKYFELIKNEHIKLIAPPNYCKYHTYHIFTVITDHRNEFIKYMDSKNIPCLIHYPIPIESTLAFYNQKSKNNKTLDFSKKIVSLPIHPFLTDDEITYICDTINNFTIQNI